MLSLVTGHGRAAPLLWLSVWKDEIATRRHDYEDACLRRLADTVPPGCRVTILAHRGFGDQKLFVFLGELGFGYVTRFRGNIRVADADGKTRTACTQTTAPTCRPSAVTRASRSLRALPPLPTHSAAAAGQRIRHRAADVATELRRWPPAVTASR